MFATVSAARRLRPEVWKNSSTALSSKEGELARSITTCAPARASLSPSPVMVLTPVLGDAATTSWPPPRRMATADQASAANDDDLHGLPSLVDKKLMNRSANADLAFLFPPPRGRKVAAGR